MVIPLHIYNCIDGSGFTNQQVGVLSLDLQEHVSFPPAASKTRYRCPR